MDDLPSYEERLSSLGDLSRDSTTLYYDSELEIPLGIMDCDWDLLGKNDEFSPPVGDGSEGETAVTTMKSYLAALNSRYLSPSMLTSSIVKLPI